MILIENWRHWRDLWGRPGSARRQQLLELLKTRPALFYWGDSWFSTPLYLNLARQSAARIDGLGRLMGKPGAQASELFSARNLRKVKEWLLDVPVDALVVSAGGNDSLSERLAGVFGDWADAANAPPQLSPAQAFDRVVRAGIFDDGQGGGILGRYQALMAMAREVQQQRPHFRVIGHGYAPLKLIGVPGDLNTTNIGIIAWLKDDVGPWLWPPMQHVLPDKAAGHSFARLLLVDGFKKRVLDALAQQHPDLFSYADFSTVPQTQDDAFWYDEIHPNEAGFAIIGRLLNDAIRNALPGPKQGAVG